ncbi:hypothetical protein, partial [Methylobacterium sp. BTF04]|uniref:hypothetical protein n=1 Tax=Methylobacterium sp. BTF04 TaxID=2708300 RepID=UPI001954778D
LPASGQTRSTKYRDQTSSFSQCFFCNDQGDQHIDRDSSQNDKAQQDDTAELIDSVHILLLPVYWRVGRVGTG